MNADAVDQGHLQREYKERGLVPFGRARSAKLLSLRGHASGLPSCDAATVVVDRLVPLPLAQVPEQRSQTSALAGFHDVAS